MGNLRALENKDERGWGEPRAGNRSLGHVTIICKDTYLRGERLGGDVNMNVFMK